MYAVMPESPKDKDQEKGDAVLRRLLKTPPAHKVKGEPPKKKNTAAKDRVANRK
jgi:hypothetical protein